MASDQMERIAWAMGLIEREMHSLAHGKLEIYFERGQIVRARVDRSEKPPCGDEQANSCRGLDK